MAQVSRGTVGYVVLNADRVMTLGQSNVLWIPSGRVPLATLFSTIAEARRAIKRTRDYAFSHGFKWSTEYRVVRLKAATATDRR